MTHPILPPVPDVVPYEDEPAKQILRKWAEDYGAACMAYTRMRLAEKAAEALSKRLLNGE